MDDRDILQRDKTAPENQIFYRHQWKCDVDPDLDSNDKFIDIEIFEGNGKI